MARATLSTLQQRYLDLIGDADGTIDAFGTRNINAAIRDILNKYNWSWALKSASLTLSSGTASLPADFNNIWGIYDARIVETGVDGNDHIFTIIALPDRDVFGSDNYAAWVTYDVANDVYKFNSNTLTGTVTVYYYTNYVGANSSGTALADLSAATDKTIVPDQEAVSYLAASKNWIGAERDIELKREYEAEAERLITALYIRDMASGPFVPEGTSAEQLGSTSDEWMEGNVS